MRTTLDLDPDVLAAIKQIAAREKSSAGKAASRLLRTALTGGVASAQPTHPPSLNGFRPLPKGSKLVTDDQVNSLREASGV